MPDLGISPLSFVLFMNMQCKTEFILSDLGYLFRSELLLQFLGLFRLFESVYMVLRTLLLESTVDLCSEYALGVYPSIFMLIFRYSLESCFACNGSAFFLLITFKSDVDMWKTFTEPVRFGLIA